LFWRATQKAQDGLFEVGEGNGHLRGRKAASDSPNRSSNERAARAGTVARGISAVGRRAGMGGHRPCGCRQWNARNRRIADVADRGLGRLSWAEFPRPVVDREQPESPEHRTSALRRNTSCPARSGSSSPSVDHPPSTLLRHSAFAARPTTHSTAGRLCSRVMTRLVVPARSPLTVARSPA
jgi:hypothetical protein